MYVCADVFNHLHVLDVSMCQDLRLIHSLHGEPAGLPFNGLPVCPCDGGIGGLTAEFVSRSFGQRSPRNMALRSSWHVVPEETVSCSFARN